MEISKEEYDDLNKYKMLWQTMKEEGDTAYVSMNKPWFIRPVTLTATMNEVELIFENVKRRRKSRME